MRIKISGLVQGVSFRFYAAEYANELGLRGLVKNLPEGEVYIEAEGDPAALQEFLLWCRKGSPGAQVKSVEVEEGQIKNHDGFRIEK